MSRRGRNRRRPIGIMSAGPTPTLSFNADVGVTSPWTTTGGPAIITDTYKGVKALRLVAGTSLRLAAGIADFAHQGPVTILICWRTVSGLASTSFTIADSSSNAATPGFQLIARDNLGLGQYKQLLSRLSNGSSFTLETPSGGTPNTYAWMKAGIAAITITANRSALDVDGTYAADVTGAVTFSAGSGGAFIVGNATVDIDVFAIDLYQGSLNDAGKDVARARMANRYSVDTVVNVAGDGVHHYAFSHLAKRSNGNLIGVYRDGLFHSGDKGVARIVRSTDNGKTWPVISTISDATYDIRDPNLSVLSNGDILCSYFLDVSGGNSLQFRRSTDGGVTFSAAQTVTKGFTEYENASAPMVEHGGALYWPVYFKNLADAHSKCFVLKSTDNGATWPTSILLADGVADGKDYFEPGILFLSGGTWLGLIRCDGDGVMYETASADGITWGALVSSGIGAFSAARLLQLASGKILALLRPNAVLMATIYKRVSAGNWSLAGYDAPGLDATFNSMVYGGMVELSPGIFGVMYSVQASASVSYTRFRVWPEYQLDGVFP